MANRYEMHSFEGKAKGGGTATPVSQILVPADEHRLFLGVYNLSEDEIIYISLGSPAVAGQGIPLYPRDGYEQKFGDITSQAVYGVTEAGKTAAFCWHTGG